MAQTSVEWLEERLTLSLGDEIKYLRGFFVIAKEMHESEIKQSWLSAWKDYMINPLEDKYYEPEAEQYYNQTFKSK